MFFKIGVLKRFTKFTGRHLCQSLLFNKVTDLRPATLLKKRLWHKCFPVNLVKFLRTAFSLEYLRWLPLCNFTEYELFKGILRRFLLLVPEYLLCVKVFYKKSCSSKFRNIHRKTPVLDSLFNKVAVFQGYNFIKNKILT